MFTSSKNQVTLSSKQSTSFAHSLGPIKANPDVSESKFSVKPSTINESFINKAGFPRPIEKFNTTTPPLKRKSWSSKSLNDCSNSDSDINHNFSPRTSQSQGAKIVQEASLHQTDSIYMSLHQNETSSTSYKISQNIESNNVSHLKPLPSEAERESFKKMHNSENTAQVFAGIQNLAKDFKQSSNSIFYEYTVIGKQNLKKIQCQTTVLEDSIKCRYVIQHFNFSVLPESLTVLYNFLNVLNFKVKSGRFLFEKTLIFENEFQGVPQEFHKRVLSDLCTILIPQFDTYFGICTGKIGKDQKLEYKRVESTFDSVCHKVTGDDIEMEKIIIKSLEQFKGPLVLNRFFYRNIKFLEDEVVYYYKKNAETIEFGLKMEDNVDEQFYELIDMLQECGIYANDSFSIDLFGWFEERPVFTYKVPLFQVFEVKCLDLQEVEEYKARVLKKIKNSLESKLLEIEQRSSRDDCNFSNDV